MSRRLAPECRRAVMEFSAREKMTYIKAMERLIYEGLKAVNKPLEKPMDKSCVNA